MSAGDIFLLVVRWLHLLAAAAWIGGSAFYLLVLRPALSRSPQSSRVANAATATEFRALVNTCIVVLVATGVILGFDRLTEGVVGAPYVSTLGAKTALSVWMFVLVWDLQRQTRAPEALRDRPRPNTTRFRRIVEAASGYNLLVIIGIVVFFLSDLLKVLFEIALSGD